MKITLKDLLDKQIFENYSILSGHDDLEHEVESVSILETPDFEHYIIEKSLILTTYYPIKTEIDLTKRLLKTLKERSTAGLIVKVHRYIDEFPNDIIDLADSLGIPVVTLNYDANLSLLFNNILAEIQMRDFSNYAIDGNYSEVLQKVYDNPTTKALMETVEHIEDLDLLIENLETKATYYSSEHVHSNYQKFRNTKNLIQRVDDMIYYAEDVIYDNRPIYKVAFLARNDRRHIIHNYIEIFKLMVVVIYQKKMEIALKQNEFLMNFVSNFAKEYTQEQLLAASRQFKWNVSFPIVLVLLTFRQDGKSMIDRSLIEYSRTVIVNKFHVSARELRYAQISDQLLFIVNIDDERTYQSTYRTMYDTLHQRYPDFDIRLTYSNPIHEIRDIPARFALMSDALAHIRDRSLPVHIYDETTITLLKLMRNIDYREVNDFIDRVLGSLIAYDKANDNALIDTLTAFIESRFNVRKTAERLFIHYNTVRYRLQLIRDLGYDIGNADDGYFELHFALYLHNQIRL